MSEFKKLTYLEYEQLAKPLLKELARMARWLAETGQRIVVVFEGRDTAGKGGSIDAIARVLNPRQCRVAALPSPSDRERGQWYFQRYIPYLPAKGEMTLFDRSWYNRAGVEPVMGFCTPQETDAFLKGVPEFERHLVDDGILLFKYWLCCDQDRQEERFENRLLNPLKRWKLSPIDVQARTRYEAYTDARERMLKATHTDFAPWTLVDFNDQALGRLTLLRDMLDRIPDTDLPVKEMEWPKLGGEPLKERYGVIQPIANYPVETAPKEEPGGIYQ
jgi:polyphosphate kinase 2